MEPEPVEPELARQALRLTLSAELTHRAGRCLGARLAPDASRDALLEAGRRMAEIAPPVERAHRLRFEPAYPGVTGGVEELRGGSRRLVLACTAFDAGGEPAAVVYTTLISGRVPQVSAAPAGAAIPADWGALAPGAA